MNAINVSEQNILRDAPESSFMKKYYTVVSVFFTVPIIVFVIAVTVLAEVSDLGRGAMWGILIAGVVPLSAAVTLMPWARVLGEQKRIAGDVLEHSFPQENPVQLDVWLPKATVLQKWTEATLVIKNGYATVTSEGRTLFHAAAKNIKVKTGVKGIKLKAGKESIRLAAATTEAGFMLRGLEFYTFRAEEIKVALSGRQPVWTVFTGGMSRTPTFPLRSQQQEYLAAQQNQFAAGYARQPAHQPDQQLAQQQPNVTAAPEEPRSAPAGWHPDPYGAARLRWWDGQQWSGHIAE